MAHADRTAAGHFDQRVSIGRHHREVLRPLGAVAPAFEGRRVDVEDLHPRQHRPAVRCPKHQSIPELKRQLPIEGEPGMVAVERTQPARHGGGADMGDQLTRRLAERRTHGPAHVDRVHNRPPVLREKDVAAVHGIGGYTGAQIDCHPVGRTSRGNRLIAAVQGPHRHRPEVVRAVHLQTVATGQGARRQGPGDHRPGTADAERTVNP